MLLWCSVGLAYAVAPVPAQSRSFFFTFLTRGAVLSRTRDAAVIPHLISNNHAFQSGTSQREAAAENKLRRKQLTAYCARFPSISISFETTCLTKLSMEVVKFGPTVVVIVFLLASPDPACLLHHFWLRNVYLFSFLQFCIWFVTIRMMMLILNAFQHVWSRNSSGLMNKLPFKVNQPCMIQPKTPAAVSVRNSKVPL